MFPTVGSSQLPLQGILYLQTIQMFYQNRRIVWRSLNPLHTIPLPCTLRSLCPWKISYEETLSLTLFDKYTTEGSTPKSDSRGKDADEGSEKQNESSFGASETTELERTKRESKERVKRCRQVKNVKSFYGKLRYESNNGRRNCLTDCLTK